eukprot:TRINITY_DN10355_c0_g1_i1.p1 TRINITY_DN10355_c0_g1~~TRINITY_DN10355_c0_g1_i1.p1  ORF type:complete len:638 (+),score=85.06 TRINITY_DN10355_c0_g1_i1:34-1947(+)
MLIARRKKGEEKTIQIKVIKLTELRLNTTQGRCFPWIKIQHGKESVCVIQTVVHEHAFTKSSDVAYDVERTLVLRSWNKLIVKVEDEKVEIGRTEINLRGLCRGIKVAGWYDLQPYGRIQVELVATNFGKIAKPEIKKTPTMNIPSDDEFLHTVSSSSPPKQLGLKEYKTAHIKRHMPHVAQGSFGIVYRGTVKDRKEEVAIKDIKVTSYQLFEEWKKEVEFMGQHKNQYIVEIYGYCAKTSILTIVMEWMENGDLFCNLHKKKPPVSRGQRIRWGRHCALGVAFLHANKILHRDIKSMNILISKENVAKHADFGCARILATNEHAFYTAAKGSPLWMAPEVRLGKAYNLSADNFSLGVVLYELFEKLPEYDYQRQTLVLPCYDFLSCGIVMPLLNWNPDRRPEAIKVAQQLDNILSNVIQTLSNETDIDQLDAEKYDSLLNTPAADKLIDAKLHEIKKDWMANQQKRRAVKVDYPKSENVVESPEPTEATNPKLADPTHFHESSSVSSSAEESTDDDTEDEVSTSSSSPRTISPPAPIQPLTSPPSQPHNGGTTQSHASLQGKATPVGDQPQQQHLTTSTIHSDSSSVRTMLYDFQRDPLSLKAGDKVRVLRQQGPWLDALTLDGKRGWIPTAYVQ